MTTPDGAQLNLDALYKICPSCFTETAAEDGSIKRVIDFNKLRALLGDNAEDSAPEAYDFTWVGKRAAQREAAAPIKKTLRPCPEESVDWENTQNLYIEGDNLEVLKLLQNSYMGKVKMIYIDPPYNTGNDKFLYPDKYAVSMEEYDEHNINEDGERFRKNTDSNGRFHSDWCSMIYQRLFVSRALLSDDGIIFISIDEHEHASLKKICDEVFGELNYIGDIVWESTTQPINAGSAKFNLQKKTEPILVYGKNKSNLSGFILKEAPNSLSYPHQGKFGKCRFEIIEKSDAGAYSRETMKYKILGQYPREGKRWQIGEEKARRLENEGKLEIVDGIVKLAVYPEDEADKKQYIPFWSLFEAEKYGTAQTGKNELNEEIGKEIGFDTVKSLTLMKELLFHLGSDYIVMDFFSGSGTTASAVLELNSEDGGNRKFIMVQIPEETDSNSEAFKAGYKNICELGKDRIRKKGARINSTKASVDVGFRVFKCDDSNMKDVYFAPNDYSQGFLSMLEDNIKEDRTDLDLLFDCMLRWGVELSLPLSSKKVGACTIHNVNDGDLVACFDGTITDQVIDAIAEMSPLRVVFRDSSFEEASQKMNLFELFKQKCGWSDYEVKNNVKVI